jgi:hypothetical protein
MQVPQQQQEFVLEAQQQHRYQRPRQLLLPPLLLQLLLLQKHCHPWQPLLLQLQLLQQQLHCLLLRRAQTKAKYMSMRTASPAMTCCCHTNLVCVSMPP